MRPCHRILCFLALLLSARELAADKSHVLVRIPLESDDYLRFTGAVHLSSPPFRAHVVFDTGSSDTWVSRGFASNLRPSTAFTIGYGGGVVSGFAAATDLQLGNDPDSVLVLSAPVGFVDDATSVLAGLDAQGVVGLGMEALAKIQANSSLLGLLAKLPGLSEPFVFSLYISSWSGAHPASQLIIGGEDHALIGSNTTWFNFDVVSDQLIRSTPSNSFGFWALAVESLVFDNVILPLKSKNGIALLDSGTSVLLLPPHIFNTVVQMLSTRFGTRFQPISSDNQSLPTCRRCQAHEFPTLAFDFILDAASQRLELKGGDYVRCDQRRQECTPMIDTIHSSEVNSQHDVIVLGTVFFRAYYARFDYSNKQVSFACTSDGNTCHGGLHPALDYHGQPYGATETHQSWMGMYAAVTALALLAGLRLLLH